MGVSTASAVTASASGVSDAVRLLYKNRNRPHATSTSKTTQPHLIHGDGKKRSGDSASSSVQGTSSTARARTTTMGPRVSVRQPKCHRPLLVKATSASRRERQAPCPAG